jgi:1-acyl-sn-glycerol-3-phosphate acyltransferase
MVEDVQRVRALLAMLFIAVATIIGSLLAFVARLLDPSGDRVVDLARLWSRAVLWVAGVRVNVEARGKLVPGQAYVFMANHLSTVDIWALFVALPIPVRMIAKKQLGAIPLFGWAMRAGRFIFIDRHNAAAARRTIDHATERIRAGASVLLFPEGTRSRDGQLQAFKKGGFHLAIDAGAPIVPVALRGTRELMPRGALGLKPGRVTVIIGDPIPTEGLTGDDRNALLDRVRNEIAAMIDR